MIDYKNKATYTLNANNTGTKNLARKRTSKRPSKQSLQLSYKFKFYITIVLILLGCYGYVYYQVKHNPRSVFYDLAKTFNKHASTKNKVTRPKTIPSRSKSWTDNTRSSSHSSQETDIKKWPINVYLMQANKKNAQLVALETSMEGKKESYFKNLINTLIHFKASDRKLINGLQFHTKNTIKILRVYLENDVLILDFNEAFEYSRYGYAGLNLQIQQILWTVFNSKGAKLEKIKNISFMINGVRKKKIGGEGMELKLFYSRKDLRKQISLKGNI